MPESMLLKFVNNLILARQIDDLFMLIFQTKSFFKAYIFYFLFKISELDTFICHFQFYKQAKSKYHTPHKNDNYITLTQIWHYANLIDNICVIHNKA